MSDHGGYIAVARGIFEHPMLAREQPLSRIEAWQWLIGQAAWKPRGERRRHTVVHLERGQLCATHRELARAWRWTIGKVQRFLQRLVACGMVALKRTESKTESETESKLTYQQTLITICNYNKFQKQNAAAWARPSQKPSQKPSQSLQQGFPFVEESSAEPTNHITKESRGPPRQERDRMKPHHGAKGRGFVWCDYGTSDWECYAADFKDVSGADVLPESRIGGRGNWFAVNGEAARPKKRRG